MLSKVFKLQKNSPFVLASDAVKTANHYVGEIESISVYNTSICAKIGDLTSLTTNQIIYLSDDIVVNNVYYSGTVYTWTYTKGYYKVTQDTSDNTSFYGIPIGLSQDNGQYYYVEYLGTSCIVTQ